MEEQLGAARANASGDAGVADLVNRCRALLAEANDIPELTLPERPPPLSPSRALARTRGLQLLRPNLTCV